MRELGRFALPRFERPWPRLPGHGRPGRTSRDPSRRRRWVPSGITLAQAEEELLDELETTQNRLDDIF